MSESGFAERRFKSRDGLELYYRDYYGPRSGGGATVLCLHGLTRSSRDFDVLAPRLARARRVLAADVRGRGHSAHDPKPERYTPAVYAEDLLELLADARETRVALVGTSMGGILSLLLATLRPSALAAVVLNDIGPVIDPVGLARIAAYVGKTGELASWDAAAEAMRGLHGLAFPDFERADWLRFARRTCREEAGRIIPDYDPAISAGTRATAAAPADLWSFYAALARIPTLVIRGELSDILSEATVAEMARRKPDLEILRVPRRGHAPTLDEPECADAIERFLSRNAASSS